MADTKNIGSKILIITAVMASLLEIIDTSIVNVAIPTMMGNLGATLEDISWVTTGYIISNAIVLPLAGWLGVRFGRKAYYTSCILLFTVTSVGCGLAPNLPVLVVFRVIQGMAGGALLPTSQSLITEAFPPEKAGMASAIYGMSVMIGPTIGPTLGGYLTDNFGWRSIFNINVPLGLAAALLSFLYVEDHKTESAARMKESGIDYWGLTFLIVGVGCLQFVLERGQADDWFSSIPITICAMAAAAALPLFIWWELHIPNPIVNLRLFKHTGVRYGTMVMGAVGMMLYALIFFIPVFCSMILGLTATDTGELFIPGAIASAMFMPLIGRLMEKIDTRFLLVTGVLIFSVAIFMMTAFTPLTGVGDMFWPLLWRGAAMAFLFVPVNAVVLAEFQGPELGQAAGLLNLARQVGGSIGIAFYSTLLMRFQDQFKTNLAPRVSLLNPIAQSQLQGTALGLATKFNQAVGLTAPRAAALQEFVFRVERQVFVLSFNRVLWLMLAMTALAIIPIYKLKTKGPIRAVSAH